MDGVKWKINGLFDADAEKVYREIEAIAEGSEYQTTDPHEILQYAIDNPKSELHKCFEWDDQKAANNWRVQQARTIVNSLVVTINDGDGDDMVSVDARVVMIEPETKKYKPVSLMNADEYARTLKRAWDELRAWKAKYKTLKDAGIQAVVSLIS